VPTASRLRVCFTGLIGLALAGCMSITPQLHPTDVAALEQLEAREDREAAYEDNYILRETDARGVRYVKGQRVGARSRSWQSLDAVLRSDRNSAAALPDRPLRVARVLTGLLAASAIVTVGGIAASAREGLDLSRLSGTSAILLGGGVLTMGFGIGTGIAYGRAKKGYDRAVDVYNDSLGLRLGLYDAEGQYRPPPGVLVDEEGFIILDQRELLIPDTYAPQPGPVAPAPIETQPIDLQPAVDAPPPAVDAPPPAAPPTKDRDDESASLVGPSRALAGP
jgi:hypothetical protein